MNNEKDKKLDDLFRTGLEDPVNHVVYKEKDWNSLDEMLDKHIEDACQFYTYDWIFKHLVNAKEVLELGYGEGNITAELVKRGMFL